MPNLCGSTNFDDEVENINFEFSHVNNKADFEIFAVDNGDNDVRIILNDRNFGVFRIFK